MTIPMFSAISPLTGKPLPRQHRIAPPDEVDTVCLQAAAAFEALSVMPGARIAEFLQAIAGGIANLGDQLLQTASEETGLSLPRLAGERDRTVFTLRTFAELAGESAWTRRVEFASDPSRKPLPRPALSRWLTPLGPVAVFGASNFPLAYSTAGGDTASALAAGCPVVVKGHPLHPATGELVAEVIAQAVADCSMPHGTFAYLSAGGDRDHEIGMELVTHDAIKAVGFTGSFKGGQALSKLCQSRREPIPVFAEMGSINPIFVLASAERRTESIADQVFASLSNSNGQMCTCPGLVFVPAGALSDRFTARLVQLVDQAPAQTMLSAKIRESFLSRVHECAQVPGVDMIARGRPAPGEGIFQPLLLLKTTISTFQRFHTLRDECFGPSTIVVEYGSEDELMHLARSIPGSLAAAVYFDSSGNNDATDRRAMALADLLQRRVGRLVLNGMTTGVEVSPAMVHGGPFPSTNQPQSTAVGAMAIERWCRPVCRQSHPL
jgi:NADP-dependent aldehyde dehydrogenase